MIVYYLIKIRGFALDLSDVDVHVQIVLQIVQFDMDQKSSVMIRSD